MEPNIQTPVSNPQVVNPMPQAQQIMQDLQPQPQMQMQSQPDHGGGKKIIKLFLIIFILAILGLGGFVGYSYFNSQKTYNAGIYNYPTSVPATPTPTDVLNPSDTSNNSIDSNNQIVDQNLNSLDSSLNSVSDSLNDKQTNLQ
nr:hypothetical protein [Candidatus Levybacteria bacterium]